MAVTIQFLGAAGTVTGSKYLIEGAGKKILVDVGIFQGQREWREKNWAKPEVDLGKIDLVLLTHAHIDHTGLLPRYCNLGLNCPVYATSATSELCRLLLPDSGHLQEEEARYRSKYGKSRHQPPLPLYTEADAIEALKLFKEVPFNQRINLLPGIAATWSHMGHILGAASIRLEIEGKVINFSGDIGRYSVPILKDPAATEFGDLLLIESTYGDKSHSNETARELLSKVINQTAKRNGAVLIPSFAVGRTQLLLYYLRELKAEKLIPDVPVIVDSPMAADATQLYRKFPGDYDSAALNILTGGQSPFSLSKLHFTKSSDDSKKLNSIQEPMIIISASGMLSGGRILHHLRHKISNPLNTVLFVGYQPPGSRGDWIKSGAKSLKLLGDEIPIRAQVAEISGLSAHADQNELLRWCRESKGTPKQVAIVHGEPAPAEHFKKTLENELKWQAFVAKYLQKITL